MSTIALYASKVNQMPDLIGDIKTSVSNYITELSTLNSKATNINSGVCDLGDVIASINSSTVTQEDLKDTLDTFYQNSENFISAVDSIDGAVADAVNQSKDDFYEDYSYLKPDCEKTTGEKIVDALIVFAAAVITTELNILMDIAAWCKENWKVILTVVIVIGAILAIVAVIATGGMALVPILTAILGACGVASGTALTAATVISLVVAAVAITSTGFSTYYNIADIWEDHSNDPDFQNKKNIWNVVSMASNLFYSAGGIFNSLTGISNSSLRSFANGLTNADFRSALFSLKGVPLKFGTNLSTFWAGIGEDAATAYANLNKTETLAQVLGANRPPVGASWTPPSMSMAINSSGNATALLSSNVGTVGASGTVIGNTWTTVEKVVLNINPNITSITTVCNYGTASQVSTTVVRTFQLPAFLQGLISYGQFSVNDIEIKSYATKEVYEAITDD